MDGIRIIALPKIKAAVSKLDDLDNIMPFGDWFSNIKNEENGRIFPHDFMSYDEQAKKMRWYFILPKGMEDTGGYQTVNLTGGIYAAAVCVDGDDSDGERVYADIKKWVNESEVFEMDERPGHYTMFHVITSDDVYDALGYRQMDIFVPIKKK